jgi:predicted RNase H-like nuclease (RuvC/YqgF family)
LVERLKSSEARLSSLSEVEQKMKEFEEKQRKDAKRIVGIEYALSVQVELHRSEVHGLEKKLDELSENFNVEQTKREISYTKRRRVQKMSRSFIEQKRSVTMLPWNVVIN